MVQGPGPQATGHGHAHEHAPADAHGDFSATAAAIGRSERRRTLRTGFFVALFTVALLTLSAELFLRVTHERQHALERHSTRANRRWVALERIAELCRARALPLFVVDQPRMTYLGESRAADWPVAALDTWFRGVCEELDLPALHLVGWLHGYADNVDRLASGAPPDCLTDQYIADERLQAALAWARERAREAGADWDALPYAEQLPWFAGYPMELPQDPDFHLTGAGYAHVARLAYEHLCAEGLLP